MKQLPEKIALDKAVNGQKLYQGSFEIQQMSRISDLLADTDGNIEFSIQFSKARGLLGKAQVKITANLALTCKISQKKFMFPVDIYSTIGFIDDLKYEEYLDSNMEASWVDNNFVKPLEIIEDELILIIPDVPFDESHNNDSEESTGTIEKKLNPFDILKNLK